jgi:hypothetical protein
MEPFVNKTNLTVTSTLAIMLELVFVAFVAFLH